MGKTMTSFLIKIIYLLFTLSLAPFIYLKMRLGKSTPSYGKDAIQVLGFIPKKNYIHPVWFHTVSVGESMGAIPLIKEFAQRHPQLQIVVTSSTTTSKELYKPLSNIVTYLFAPLDSPCAVHRFVNRLKPSALIIMETELWPNLLSKLSYKNIPVIVINARLSNKSAKRYSVIKNCFNNYIGNHVTKILCQTVDDKNNFEKLGIDDNKLKITGFLKYDIKPNISQITMGKKLKEKILDKLVYVAASTHEGEDEILLEQYKEIHSKAPNTMLILIPRHPERFEAVTTLSKKMGFRTANKSLNNLDAYTDVLIGDSMGELPMYFSMSDLVFMGGSIANIGGHNPLEAIALGKVVVSGEIIYNFKQIYKELYSKDACILGNVNNLPNIIYNLLIDTKKREKIALNAYKILQENKGSTEKTLKIIEEVILNK
jgi:3-deoxy-D-manno-octulosonic-acid transferase